MKRNQKIYELVIKGRQMELAERTKNKLTLKLIGKKYGISKQCIRQIFLAIKKTVDNPLDK
jgi:hypothetical protein